MEGVDWRLILASFAFTSAVFGAWVLIHLLRRQLEITNLNRRVQNLLDDIDGDD